MNPKKRFLTRRKFLAGFGLAGLGSVVDVHWVEPRWLRVKNHTIKLAKSDNRPPLKILHLSDFHRSAAVDLDFIKESIQLGLGLKPDLICLTGDFITRGFKQLDGYSEVLKLLANNAPTFACPGNHDGGGWAADHDGFENTDEIRELVTKGGGDFLFNTSKTLRLGTWNLTVVGLGDLWAGDLQPSIAFPSSSSADTTTLVLSHNPDTKEQLKPYSWDLMLCGHTHGGQVRLPFIGAPILPVKDKRFVEGLYQWDARWIHITRGVGNLYGVRFNCRPEINLLTLT